MRRIFHKLHLWLGLTSGLLVFIIAFTGALYVFHEEIENLNGYHSVKEQNATFLPPSQLQKIAENLLPGKPLNAIQYGGKGQAVEASFYGYAPSYYYLVYLHPYSGNVLKVKDMNRDFFRFVIEGHCYLWLPPQTGHPLVATATLVFAITLLAGLFIWIPRKQKAWKNRIRFRWNKRTKWSRINFDLHAIGGLYASVFGLIFAVTGLVWGFQWFAQSYYHLLGGEKAIIYSDVVSSKKDSDLTPTSTNATDSVWNLMRREYPHAASIEIHPPHNDSVAISANANPSNEKYWKTDYRYFDQHNLKELPARNIYGRYADAGFADKVFRMNYDIHTGAIFSLTGKIIAFIMSLLIASLPVTGFVIWWRKRRGRKD